MPTSFKEGKSMLLTNPIMWEAMTGTKILSPFSTFI